MSRRERLDRPRAGLSDGSELPTRTLKRCVGVRPDPLVAALGLVGPQEVPLETASPELAP